MTYDPSKDEPVFSEREMKTLISETIRYTIGSMRRELFGSDTPWATDTVYRPGKWVSHRGETWIARVETASEPCEGAIWERYTDKHNEGAE
jgi:hypothetical protein